MAKLARCGLWALAAAVVGALILYVASVAVLCTARMRTPDDDGVSSELWKVRLVMADTPHRAVPIRGIGRRTWRPRASETGWLHVEFFTRARPLALDVDGIPVAVSAPTGDGWAVSPDAPDPRGALPRRVYVQAQTLAPKPQWDIHADMDLVRLPTGGAMHVAGLGRPEAVLVVCGRNSPLSDRAVAAALQGNGQRALGILYYESHTYARHGDWAMDCAMPSASLAPSAADVGSALDALGAEHVHLVSYSLGSLVATLHLSRRADARVVDHVLLAPYLSTAGQVPLPLMLGTIVVHLLAPVLPHVGRVPVLRRPSPSETTVYAAWRVQDPLRADPVLGSSTPALTLSFCQAVCKALVHLTLARPRIATRALVVTSSSDCVIDPRACLRRARELYRDVASVDVPGAGHWLLSGDGGWDSHRPVVAHILQFWKHRAS